MSGIVKWLPDAVTPVNIMLVPNDPAPNFSAFNYKELQLRSPQFHVALAQGVSEGDFLGLAKSGGKSGNSRMAALLNIEAKLRATALKQGKAVDYVRLIKNIDCCEGGRVKAEVAANMPSKVRGLKTFTELNEDLNEVNHKGLPRQLQGEGGVL